MWRNWPVDHLCEKSPRCKRRSWWRQLNRWCAARKECTPPVHCFGQRSPQHTVGKTRLLSDLRRSQGCTICMLSCSRLVRGCQCRMQCIQRLLRSAGSCPARMGCTCLSLNYSPRCRRRMVCMSQTLLWQPRAPSHMAMAGRRHPRTSNLAGSPNIWASLARRIQCHRCRARTSVAIRGCCRPGRESPLHTACMLTLPSRSGMSMPGRVCI